MNENTSNLTNQSINSFYFSIWHHKNNRGFNQPFHFTYQLRIKPPKLRIAGTLVIGIICSGGSPHISNHLERLPVDFDKDHYQDVKWAPQITIKSTVLFNSLPRYTAHIYTPVVHSPHKESVLKKEFPCHGIIISMAYCKTAVTPLLAHSSNLAPSHWFGLPSSRRCCLWSYRSSSACPGWEWCPCL